MFYIFVEMNVDDKTKKAWTYYKTGNDFLKRGDFIVAADYYKRATEIDPYYYKAFCNLGIAYKNLNQQKLAEDAYLKAIKLNPNDSIIMNNLGNIYVNMDRLDEAITFYKQAIKINPQYKDAIYNLGQVYYFTGQQQKAVDLRMRLEKLKLKPVGLKLDKLKR